MPSLTREIKPTNKLHGIILQEIRRRVKLSERELMHKRDIWSEAENAVLAYIPETEEDAARRYSRDYKGQPKYTTMKIPYTYGLVLSAWTYWSTVFFSRDPWFQYSGRHGEAENQTQALEALVSYQVITGGNQGALYSWLYDVARYGLGVLSLFWDEEIKIVSSINYAPGEVDPVTGVQGEGQKMQATIQLQGYTGNRLWNVNPKDFLYDPRGTVRNFQQGEYCAVRHKLPWALVKQREKQGYYTNVDEIDPNIMPRFEEEWNAQPTALERPEDFVFNSEWGNSENERRYPSRVPIYEVYLKLIPKDWDLGNSDYPEIWVFTCTANWKTVIGAQPLGAYHCKFPFHTMEMEADAYSLANRGIPETIKTVQQSMDWLLNSHMFNVRASLNNLFLVDPTRVVTKDITDPMPGGMIRLRPGWNAKEFPPLTQLAVQDITRSHLVDMQQMLGIGERATGLNDQIMGVLNQGQGSNRKTATEVRQSSTFGANRHKTIAEYMSATSFEPLSRMLVSNTQQYFDLPMKLKIVGNLASLAGPQFIMVTPEIIAGEYDFIGVDGTLPIDRFAQATLWQNLLGAITRFPQLLQQLDMFKIFSWVANLAGLRNIDTFRIQTQVMQPGAPPPPGMMPVTAGQMGQAPSPGMMNAPGNGQQFGGMGPVPTGVQQ